MRIVAILVVISILACFLYFKVSLKRFSNELTQDDQNPELINYLQGDWTEVDDPNSVIRIKRDSMIGIHNDSIKSAGTLRYIFAGTASAYFTKDSAFLFSGQDGRSSKANDFVLKADDSIVYYLKYVSKSKLQMSMRGIVVNLVREKE